MTSTSAGTLEGTLSKWTNVMKGWQYRFFVLDENAGLLSYYTVSDQHTWLSDGKFCCFFLSTSKRVQLMKVLSYLWTASLLSSQLIKLQIYLTTHNINIYICVCMYLYCAMFVR